MARGATAERSSARADGTRSMRDVASRQREEHGGLNWGAAFFGWLVSIGVASLLIAVLSAAGAAIGLTEHERLGGHRATRAPSSIVGGIVMLVDPARSPTTPAATWPAACRASTARARDSACG